MFNLAIDSKLRACDLTRLRVCDVCHGHHVASRATIMQQKTQWPVQFEITDQTRHSVEAWIKVAALVSGDFLFPSRLRASPHISTRQYARVVHRWIASIGPDDTAYGTHTMRRTKASLIYRRTSFWIGRRLDVAVGDRVIGEAKVVEVLNALLVTGANQP